MKTNIEVDDKLMEEVLKMETQLNKKQVVDLALRNYVSHLKRLSLLQLFGKVKWDGNLDEMRSA